MWMREFRFLCKQLIQNVKRSGNRIAKCDRAAFQSLMGLVHRLEMLCIARYINFKTDSSSGNTAWFNAGLQSERHFRSKSTIFPGDLRASEHEPGYLAISVSQSDRNE